MERVRDCDLIVMKPRVDKGFRGVRVSVAHAWMVIWMW
jgi:hypothetical protein